MGSSSGWILFDLTQKLVYNIILVNYYPLTIILWYAAWSSAKSSFFVLEGGIPVRSKEKLLKIAFTTL